LLQRLGLPLRRLQDLDARLERRLVACRVFRDLLLRLLIQLDELGVEPHGHLARDVDRGAGAGLHGRDRLQDGVLLAVDAQLLDVRATRSYSSPAPSMDRY